ncbi:MAG: sigma 54-interacting transcriptional regulator, partial [Proteobacteria bacterium]|nr:sigma 54-interacting transcriptional regulator [Pseudomonadota bacterium]
GHGQDYVQTLEAIIRTMPDGLLIVDHQGTIVGVNPALCAITGYEEEDLVNHPCSVLEGDTCMLPEGGSFTKHCPLFAGGPVERKRCTIRQRNGRRVYILKNATTINDPEGKPVLGVETLVDITDLVRQEREVARLKKLTEPPGFHGLVGDSPLMRDVYDMTAAAAQSEAPVILFGASGTGKELAARAIHDLSPRADKPYLTVNCAALNPGLLESELFGHVRGAFTGAHSSRIGRFEAARGGTLLLDEVGDLPPEVQVKLLRVIEAGTIERVGDHRPIDVDVRVISATHRDLDELIAAGRFRQDLYYRLNVIPIRLPPLWERTEDIPLLANHLLEVMNRRGKKRITGLDPAVLEVFRGHPWPGNVRQLINVLEYAYVAARDQILTRRDLPPEFDAPAKRMVLPLEMDEDRRIAAALEMTDGNKTAAAELLGISRVTLWKKLKKQAQT